jgi:phage baseplate assembly protein gpV
MKVYILNRKVDLGSAVEAVYASLESVPHELSPTKFYKYDQGGKLVFHSFAQDQWDVAGDFDLWVESMEVIE